MKRAKFTLPIAAAAVLIGCVAGLPPTLRRDIADEHERLLNAAQEIQRSQQTLKQKIAADPDLFRNTPAPARWTAEFQAASETLHTAEETDRDLNQLAAHNRAEERGRAESLLASERALRRKALDRSQAVVSAASYWLNFRRNLPANLERMKQDYAAVHSVDLGPLTKKVEQAENDWPGKKNVLETRLAGICALQHDGETLWDKTAIERQQASSNNIPEPQLAELIEANDTLTADSRELDQQSTDLRAASGQLYDSWDKILVDLDKGRDDGAYRERIKTVRSHFTDVAAKQSETSSSEEWVAVPEPAFEAVENDIGMSLAHKDAGLFDSEAVTTPQPAGFAYIAPESQGSNQYGYWTHDAGHSVWTWLPQYLLLRELLWNHSYRPVVLDEYRGYRTAEQVGRTYYGRTTPASPPKYGTHGSFTQTTYASSRYVQSGGYRSSPYASHGSFNEPRAEAGKGPFSADRDAGHHFGTGARPSSGRHFGGSRGFGHSFGRHR
jgi:hypothetical protein